jgi:hypothetical protein
VLFNLALLCCYARLLYAASALLLCSAMLISASFCSSTFLLLALAPLSFASLCYLAPCCSTFALLFRFVFCINFCLSTFLLYFLLFSCSAIFYLESYMPSSSFLTQSHILNQNRSVPCIWQWTGTIHHPRVMLCHVMLCHVLFCSI